MTRYVIAATAFLSLLALDRGPASGQEKARRHRNAEEAANWLKENGDKIVLYLGDPPTRGLLFSTDKKFVESRPKESSFRMTKDEAAGVVQVLVETGLWGHSHPPYLGLQPPARYLGLHAQGADGGGGFWKLGEVDDDVSSLLIVKYLLKTLDGDRKAALAKWLEDGVGGGSKSGTNSRYIANGINDAPSVKSLAMGQVVSGRAYGKASQRSVAKQYRTVHHD